MTNLDIFNTDCYAQTPEKSKEFSEDVSKFFQDKYTFDFCIDQSGVNGSCDGCSQQYSKLNNLFERMEVSFNGNLCLDIRAEMGRVRDRWSVLGCVIPIGYNIFVLSVAASIIVITFLIYLVFRRFSDVNPPGLAVQKRLASQLDIQSSQEATSLLREEIEENEPDSGTSSRKSTDRKRRQGYEEV